LIARPATQQATDHPQQGGTALFAQVTVEPGGTS
jgi:hypothetical protein